MSREEIKNRYQIPLDNKVKDLLEDFGINSNEILAGKLICNNELDLDRFIRCFTEQIRAIGDRLPTSKFNKSVKPYWDDILNQLKNDKKETRHSWVSSGKPREADNPNYEAYKEAKRNFRKALRRKKFEYDVSCMNELAEKQDFDQKYFWYVVNRNKPVRSGAGPIKNDKGTLLTNIDIIREEWTKYYTELFSDNYDYKGDREFYNNILQELQNIRME